MKALIKILLNQFEEFINKTNLNQADRTSEIAELRSFLKETIAKNDYDISLFIILTGIFRNLTKAATPIPISAETAKQKTDAVLELITYIPKVMEQNQVNLSDLSKFKEELKNEIESDTVDIEYDLSELYSTVASAVRERAAEIINNLVMLLQLPEDNLVLLDTIDERIETLQDTDPKKAKLNKLRNLWVNFENLSSKINDKAFIITSMDPNELEDFASMLQEHISLLNILPLDVPVFFEAWQATVDRILPKDKQFGVLQLKKLQKDVQNLIILMQDLGVTSISDLSQAREQITAYFAKENIPLNPAVTKLIALLGNANLPIFIASAFGLADQYLSDRPLFLSDFLDPKKAALAERELKENPYFVASYITQNARGQNAQFFEFIDLIAKATDFSFERNLTPEHYAAMMLDIAKMSTQERDNFYEMHYSTEHHDTLRELCEAAKEINKFTIEERDKLLKEMLFQPTPQLAKKITLLISKEPDITKNPDVNAFKNYALCVELQQAMYDQKYRESLDKKYYNEALLDIIKMSIEERKAYIEKNSSSKNDVIVGLCDMAKKMNAYVISHIEELLSDINPLPKEEIQEVMGEIEKKREHLKSNFALQDCAHEYALTLALEKECRSLLQKDTQTHSAHPKKPQ